MSSNAELFRGRLQPSSSTTTALMLTYRPVILLLFAAPILVTLLPFVVTGVRVVFWTTTDQHALLSIGTTVLFSKILENSIMNSAPTEEIAMKSLERSRGGIFLATFAASVFAIHLVVVPLEKFTGLKLFSIWSPTMSISSALTRSSERTMEMRLSLCSICCRLCRPSCCSRLG